MKKLLNIPFSKKNYVKIIFCVLFAAASQPLVAWIFARLAGLFFLEKTAASVVVQNVILLVVAFTMSWASDTLKTDIIFDSELVLRKKVFSSIYSLPISEFEKNDSGVYYNQIGRDVQILQNYLFETSLSIIVDVLTLFIIAILLLYCHWMSLVIVLMFLIPLIINNALMPKKIEVAVEQSKGTLSNMVVKLKDVLSGHSVAKFQGGDEYIEETMHGYFSQATSFEKKTKKLHNLSKLIATASVTLSQFSGLFVALYLMRQARIDFSQFLLIFQLGMMINIPLVDLINSLISIKSFKPYIEKTDDILSTQSLKSGCLLDSIESITFNNVSFTYPEKHRSVLRDFSFRFEKGKKYLIIGESGSGKTTLIRLLLGILKPSQGSIFYNDMDQKNLSEYEIYHHSALVPQQLYIFDDTIRRNIDLRGECTDAELNDIIKKTKLESFFAANHYTLETEISSEILQVSGGEKARIGLARALTLEKSIIIYDEVLSSLDAENSKIIEEVILSNNDLITIHIAHKSTSEYLVRYDEVIRLNIFGE